MTVVHCLRASELFGSPVRSLYAGVERGYLATVDGAVFNSEATRAATEDLVGRPVSGIVALPAADHLAPPPPGVGTTAPAAPPLRVLSVANVVPGKGLHVLVEAVSRLPRGSIRLTVLGSLTMDTSYVRRLRRQIRTADLDDVVELMGTVPNADVAAHLGRSHVLVGPSFYEAAGIAYLEAMRCGVPVIATSAGGAPEIVADGREGFLVPPDDVGALTERLGRLRSDPDLLVRLGRAAHDRSARHPTWAQSFAPLRPFLSSLVAGRNTVSA